MILLTLTLRDHNQLQLPLAILRTTGFLCIESLCIVTQTDDKSQNRDTVA